MSGDAGPVIEDDLARLRRQVAALTDFVTIVTAALIADQALTAAIVQALLAEASESDLRASVYDQAAEVTVSVIARDVLTIVGRLKMPSPVRLVPSAATLAPD